VLDTKLKGSRRWTVVLVILAVMIPGFVIMSQYWEWYVGAETSVENEEHSVVVSKDFLKTFLDAGFILYNTESKREEDSQEISTEQIKDILRDNGPGMQQYERIYPYLDYRVKDADGKEITRSIADSGEVLTENNMSSYELGMKITYDEYGNPDVRILAGDYKSEQSVAMREIINDYDDSDWEVENYNEEKDEWETIRLEKPKNRTFLYAMTASNLMDYIGNYEYIGYGETDFMRNVVLILTLVVAVAAWLLPALPFWYTKELWILRAPFEVVLCVFFAMMNILGNNLWWISERAGGSADIIDFLIWTIVFTVIFWAATCLRQVYTMGVGRYMKERMLCVRYWQYIRRGWKCIVSKVQNWISHCYHFIDRIDLNRKSDRTIFKIVAVNFIVLALICTMWLGGIFALMIYSAVVFWLLRKYFSDLQEKYAALLRITGEIARGNLDVEIREDLGIFSPFIQEIQKIQTGFKKAVDEEVKSQRMKTDLITNVSHDLKTPLTAIITYVNLLKDEKDAEKQKDYIGILERKSMRLKALIEDLFEISKANSKNVTLNIVDVDVVNLFKQVKLEMDDKIAESDLDFRCIYPEEKVVASLDSQKTYRVFENLLVNIIKYAMPHTRVYIEITKEEREAVVRMKNVSAAELDFNTDEITERFVRGDVSRNTEGSGLGLAIAKSFVELQKGKFKIETEADLFKVEVRF
jgi:signal transduction histidine kinase